MLRGYRTPALRHDQLKQDIVGITLLMKLFRLFYGLTCFQDSEQPLTCMLALAPACIPSSHATNFSDLSSLPRVASSYLA